MTSPTAAAQPVPAPSFPPPWRTLADGRRLERRPAPTIWQAVAVVCLANALALVSILLIGSFVSRRAADGEALRGASAATDLLGTSVLEPALEDGLLDGDPGSIARLDAVVTRRMLTPSLVRVKLWTFDGRVVYSDEPRLIGRRFSLDPEEADGRREALNGGPMVAELTKNDTKEVIYEQSQGPLLEVYRRVTLPNGTPLLFETYSRYSQVAQRRGEVWRAFAPITIGAVLLLQLCQLPLAWTLVHRLRAAQRERERLLGQVIDASTDERRRIAGNVHDDVVQGLAGASFVIAGAVDAVERGGLPTVAHQLRDASSGIRASIRGLRSMLVEIYPPSVSVAGLAAALQDLVAPLRAQGIDVDATTPAIVELPRDVEALVFRVAQETLRNVAQHSAARTATLTLVVTSALVSLDITDNGLGLDLDQALGRRDGHVGLQVLRDLAEQAGALLQIASAPGAGTKVRLQVPLP